MEHAIQLAGRVAMWEADLCFVRGRGGDHARAREVLSSLQERERTGEFISPFDLAVLRRDRRHRWRAGLPRACVR